ncbi:MAG: SHOCT domain-containing protein [Clostridia bacterium]|jgi:hypothetical protein|nr:SHOCT domain-containing protein [Clostridia bacterium]
MALVTYCGGIPSATKTRDMNVFAFPKHVEFDLGMFKGKFKILYENITNISLKTSEQISKDVSLSNLLLFGVLAFGAKKTTKEITNYLVIDYSQDNISSSVILTGKAVLKLHSSILKEEQEYFKKHPEKIKKTDNTQNSSDPYEEIEKLHGLLEKNIITQEEFDKKKASLLNL